ncbi:MAG: SpoIIE family protein phosphatase [Eubacteriaceae bacterium]|nr:SpoIIE family protein phosphatase [Eubacteriaceae bacterium]
MSFEEVTQKKRRLPKVGKKTLISFFKLILTAIVAFFVSSVCLFDNMAPFAFSAMAFLTIRSNTSEKAAFICIIGAYMGGSMNAALQAVIVLVLLLAVKTLAMGRISILGMSLVAGISTLAIGLGVSYFAKSDALSHIYAAIQAAIVFASTHIFYIGVQGFPTVFDAKRRTNIEFCCVAVLVSLAACGLARMLPFQVDVLMALAAFFCLFSSLYIGPMESFIFGAISSLVFMASYNAPFEAVGLLCVASLCCAIARPAGRFATSGLFVAAISGGAFLLDWEAAHITTLSSVAGAAAFLAMSSILKNLATSSQPATMGKAELTSLAMNRIIASEIELQKSMIKEISRNISKTEVGVYPKPAKEISKQLAADSCASCPKYTSCWDGEAELTYALICDVSDLYLENSAVPFSALPDEFKLHCMQAPMMFKMICALLDGLKAKQNNQLKSNKFKQLANEQFKHLSQVLDKLYLQISRGLAINEDESAYTLLALQGAGINIDSAITITDFNRRQKVYLTSVEPLANETVKIDVPAYLTESLRTNMVFDYSLAVGGGKEHSYCYVEDYKHKITYGARGGVKSDYDTSGDNISTCVLSNGYFMLALCDGMGSGKNAGMQSERVLSMFEELLNSGFDENASTHIVNSILLLDENEAFVTLDLFLFDLDKGLGEFIKAGGAPTYIKRDNELVRVEMETLPLGILEETHVKKSTRPFKKGDFLYFMSDGFYESFSNEDNAIEESISKHNYRNPQKIADMLFDEALANTGGEAVDDVTIVVARIR